MWPKALMELLPHLTRLVPVANRYFQSKSAAEDATRVALERKLDQTAAALHKDIAEVSAALPVADISRQLSQQNKALTELATGLREIQSRMETVQSQVEGVQVQVESLDDRLIVTLLSLTLAISLVICILLVLVLVKLHK